MPHQSTNNQFYAILSDDNLVNTRFASLIQFKKYGCNIIFSKISHESIHILDAMFNCDIDINLRRNLLSIIESAVNKDYQSENSSMFYLNKAAEDISKSISKEKIDSSMVKNFVRSYLNYTTIIDKFKNYTAYECFQRYFYLQNLSKTYEDESIINKMNFKLPLLEDGSLRLIGCAGTRRMCDLLDAVYNTMLYMSKENLSKISKIYVGRHGLSVKSIGNEYKNIFDGKKNSLFDNSRFITSLPDFGHNTKIDGDTGYEKCYFDKLYRLKGICKFLGIPFNHFTTNSFYTSPNGETIPGSRLSLIRMTDSGPQIEIYGDMAGFYPKEKEPDVIPINLDSKICHILETLCFTKRSTYMNDLKLAWIISNFEKLEQYFTPISCSLISRNNKSKSYIYCDMMFHKFNKYDQNCYNLCSQKVGLSDMNEINQKIHQSKLEIFDIEENFITSYDNSFEVNRLFLVDFLSGIKNLKVSAMVTDPGCGHIKKSHNGYFPLGPQDGDDLMALYAILHPEGLKNSEK